jgi:hypothetical protein
LGGGGMHARRRDDHAWRWTAVSKAGPRSWRDTPSSTATSIYNGKRQSSDHSITSETPRVGPTNRSGPSTSRGRSTFPSTAAN